LVVWVAAKTNSGCNSSVGARNFIRAEAYRRAGLCRKVSRPDSGRTVSYRLQSSIHLGNARSPSSLPGRRNCREARTSADPDNRVVSAKITDDHHRSSGRSVLVFPQGTRMDEMEPIAFKRGVELLYSKLGAPVLPVLVNSGKFWGPSGSSKRGGTITVSYLAPIPPGMSAELFVRKAEAQMEAERSKLP
jgi:hypothetical protein